MKWYWLALGMLLANVAGVHAQAPLPSSPASKQPAKVVNVGEAVPDTSEGTFHRTQWQSGPIPDASVGLQGSPAASCSSGGCSSSGCWDSGCSTHHTGPAPIAWFQAEYLLWWVRDGQVPTLVGQTPTAEIAGGNTNIQTINRLFGGNLEFDGLSGVRLSGGSYFDDEGVFGWDVSFFQLEQGDEGASFVSNGDPVIGPTFFDPVQNRNILVLASLPPIGSGPLAPGLRMGRVDVTADNRLWGAELNARSRLPAIFFADRLDLLLGVRHLQYGEGLSVTTHSEPLPGNPGALVIDTRDTFTALNQFWGPQIGLESKTFIGPRLSIDVIGKIGIGNMHEVVNINGTTTLGTFAAPGTPSARGILAQPSNSGRFERDQFTMVSELTVNAGVQLCRFARLKVGYNLIYVGRVQRVGEQIDGVDARAVPSLASFDPTAQTTFPRVKRNNHSRFWAQGLNCVLEVAY